MSRFQCFTVVLASVLVVGAGSGCCCLDRCCTTSVGVGDCTSYPGSDGCLGDVCGGCCGGADVGVAPVGPLAPVGGCGGCVGGWYSGGGSCGGCCGGFGGCGPFWGRYGWAPGCGPVMGILRIVRQALVCGFGCGQVYWGDWISDPPACSDPCCFSSDGGCIDGCATSCGGCDSGCVSTSQRNYNWGKSNNWRKSSTCQNGVCQTNNGARHLASRSRGNLQRHNVAGRMVNTRTRATKPQQFQAGDRVVHVTKPERNR